MLGRQVRLVALALVLASCASARAEGQPQAQTGPVEAKREELQEVYVGYLKREGYSPEIDSDGNVTFKLEGGRYVILIDPKDRAFFHLAYFGFWKVETDADRQKALAAANQAMMTTKLAKVLVTKKTVVATVGLFVREPAEFATFFERAVRGVQLAVRKFADEMAKN